MTEAAWQTLAELFEFPPDQAEYLINYSPRFSYVFVEIPKAGCSTIKRTLQSMEAEGRGVRLPENVHDKANSPLQSPADAVLTVRELLREADLFRFCYVRNPFTRVLSAYLDKIVENEWERDRLAPTLGLSPEHISSLKVFLEAVAMQPNHMRDIHWRTQTSLLRPDEIPYDFVGRFESIGASLRRVVTRVSPTAFGGESERVAFHATNAARKVAHFIGAEEAALVREIFADDFENFGYSRDPHFATV